MGGNIVSPFARLAPDDRAADYAQQLDRVEILQGRIVDVHFTANGSQYGLAEHGLGRAFVGAFLMGQSGGEQIGKVYTPERILTVALQYDPAIHIAVRWSESYTSDGLFRYWVF